MAECFQKNDLLTTDFGVLWAGFKTLEIFPSGGSLYWLLETREISGWSSWGMGRKRGENVPSKRSPSWDPDYWSLRERGDMRPRRHFWASFSKWKGHRDEEILRQSTTSCFRNSWFSSLKEFSMKIAMASLSQAACRSSRSWSVSVGNLTRWTICSP